MPKTTVGPGRGGARPGAGRKPKPSTPLFVKLRDDVAALIPPLVEATGQPKTRVVEEALLSYAREQNVTAAQVLAEPEQAEPDCKGNAQEVE